jgi:hypothetical protein
MKDAISRWIFKIISRAFSSELSESTPPQTRQESTERGMAKIK